MRDEKLYYVYILSSKSRAIYVGMTGFLMAGYYATGLVKAALSPKSIEFTGWCTTRFFIVSRPR